MKCEVLIKMKKSDLYLKKEKLCNVVAIFWALYFTIFCVYVIFTYYRLTRSSYLTLKI